MIRASRTAFFVLLLSAALLAAVDASARTETLRWTHSNPSQVDNFRIYSGASSGSYGPGQDVGVPPTDGQGAFVFDLEVPPDNGDVYVAVSAWSQGLESDLSNERVKADPGAPPPPPPPPPPPGQANAAVVSFSLWNAATDAVIDVDFTDGETINRAVTDCTSIEAVGNAYLSQDGSPGSVMWTIDGVTPGSCDNAPLSHQNEPPFAWEDGVGVGGFECATSLGLVGNHTLMATPFDGDDCTGLEGAPMSVDFEVIDAPAPPPPIGRPGKPELVIE